NRSCSPLSRRSRGRIEPPPITFEGRESRLQIRGNPHHQFARKSAPQLQFPANPVAGIPAISIASQSLRDIFTDDYIIGAARTIGPRRASPTASCCKSPSHQRSWSPLFPCFSTSGHRHVSATFRLL